MACADEVCFLDTCDPADNDHHIVRHTEAFHPYIPVAHQEAVDDEADVLREDNDTLAGDAHCSQDPHLPRGVADSHCHRLPVLVFLLFFGRLVRGTLL